MLTVWTVKRFNYIRVFPLCFHSDLGFSVRVSWFGVKIPEALVMFDWEVFPSAKKPLSPLGIGFSRVYRKETLASEPKKPTHFRGLYSAVS